MGNRGMSEKLVISNVRVFRQIATEAFQLMQGQMSSGRRPQPDGPPGWILTFDPEQKSFKNALVVLAFVGVCLEAVLHLLIVEQQGIKAYKTHDRKTYEDKLRLLGCDDEEILELCTHFRKVRREVVHEKAHIDNGEIRKAQSEAKAAISLLDKVFAYFKL
ncbi:hypothetical protein [Pelobacter seleniigenes]|uniref:hypothetical protein n=1 Tax=Pelobacter seleniigenes TaxID=407188 RepID=UPI0004A6D6C0|nr:hypothetical protein [Pelobacter seleniigenes]